MFKPLLRILLLMTATLAAPLAHAAEVQIVDGDTLVLDGISYRLYGIDAPEYGQKCTRDNGQIWMCGREATLTLKGLTAGQEVHCDDRGGDGEYRILSVCHAGWIELNAAMVRLGFAWTVRTTGTAYAEAEQAAEAEGLGIWRTPTQPAWEYRAESWATARRDAPEGCPIKGEVGNSGRIYHPPWSPWYKRAKVSEAEGERWFCSEREAFDAGWREPVWGR